MLIKLARKSLSERKNSVLLSLIAMTVSIFVLLGVEHIRQQTKASFTHAVSGVDLIVGARTGSLNLLLYSVFRIGAPTNNIRWETYQTIANNPQVKWTIPISLGDSHRGFRVLGTTEDYFEHFSYGQQHHLALAQGTAFKQPFELVLGAEVAEKLDYKLGDKLTLAHGIAATRHSLHTDNPFTVVGILQATGTPIDQTLHVSLQSLEAIHKHWQSGIPLPHQARNKNKPDTTDLTPNNITAFFLGLNSKMTTFQVQNAINNYPQEPLMAILPGVALSELWQMMRILENTLILVSILVYFTACLGMSSMLLSSMRERKKEMQLLRVIGAPTYFLFGLIQVEALLITLLAVLLGISLLATSLFFLQDYLLTTFSVYISMNILTGQTLYAVMAMFGASFFVSLIPSLGHYGESNIKND
ncbi:MAG: ABC transporter permease [Pseudomonadota bacterium]